MGGRFVGCELNELDGILESARTQHEAAGFKDDVAEEHVVAFSNAVEVGDGGTEGGEGVVMAVEDDDGTDAEHGIHGESLGGGNANGDKALPTTAAHRPARGKPGKPAGGQAQGALDGSGRDERRKHGGGLRSNGDRISGFRCLLLRRDAWFSAGGRQIFHAHLVSEEDTIERGEAEAAAAMKEVGDMRLGQPRASSQQ